MKDMDRNVIFFYGSQTGTAEDYAARLAKEGAARFGMKTMTADLEEYDLSYLDTLPADSTAFFIMSTYGEGEPTDNAVEFYELLTGDNPDFSKSDEAEDPAKPLSNLRYVVFGLGNKTYEHFNAIARNVDKRLTELGATQLCPQGEGDDDGSLEEDFLGWKDEMWSGVCEAMGIDENAKRTGPRVPAYDVTELDEVAAEQFVFMGELGEKRPAPGTRIIVDAKNPFTAPITTREVYNAKDRHCVHGEIDITGSGITYQSGDHVAVWPMNAEPEVQRIARLLGFEGKLNTVINVKSTDPTATKASPFPVPTTYETIFRHYLDISAPPSRQTINNIVEFAPNDETREILTKLGEDKEYYKIHVAESRRSIADVLEFAAAGSDVSFATIPFDVIIESLSRLQCRYYSISSSPRMHPFSIHVTCTVLQYNPTPTPERKVHGVSSNYLYSVHTALNPDGNQAVEYKLSGPRNLYQPAPNQFRLPVHIRHSNFKLPRNSALPVVMIGPGTGVAPFRGFVQERVWQKKQGRDVGATLLFFGCRRRDEDFMYADEFDSHFASLNQPESTGSEIITAFSREEGKKVYVQHRLAERASIVWDCISKGGYFYVCGDAKNMARDVQAQLLRIVSEHGEMTEEKAARFIKELRGKGRYQEDVWS